MDVIDFFVQHYRRLHMQVERDFLHGLTEAQMRLRPQGLNSIAWLVWHMARYEDILNLLLAGRPKVLDEEHWLPRLQVSEPTLANVSMTSRASSADHIQRCKP